MPLARPRFTRRAAPFAQRLTRRAGLGTLRRMPEPSTPEPDYERRPYWHATMPALPVASRPAAARRRRRRRHRRRLHRINAARELARRGAAVTLLEAETLGFGGSTRNGGIVHPGYKWGPKELIERYGEDTGRALFRETMDAYELVKRLIVDEAIDCEFRECGYLDVA